MKHRNELRQIHQRFFNPPEQVSHLSGHIKLKRCLQNKKHHQLPGERLPITGTFVGNLRQTFNF